MKHGQNYIYAQLALPVFFEANFLNQVLALCLDKLHVHLDYFFAHPQKSEILLK